MTKTAAKPKSLAAMDPARAHDAGFEFEIMDVLQVAPDETGRRDPAKGSPTGMFLTVTGHEGTAYRKLIEQRVDAAIKADYAGSKPELVTTGIAIERAIETCCACTSAWRGVVLDEAEGPLEFTPDNLRRVYSLAFVRAQALEAIENSANFSPG